MATVRAGQRRFSVGEYERMGEAGVFYPEERVELIRGVIRNMSPKGSRHLGAVLLANHLFSLRLAGRACVQIQDPLPLPSLDSAPEPDVVVFSTPDPRDVVRGLAEPLLVIEVADSSLRFDRKVKVPLYAEAGIADCWIVNLVDNTLEVYRSPKGGAYETHRAHGPTVHVAPLAFPDLEIQVSELLP